MSDQEYMAKVKQHISRTKSYLADNNFLLSQITRNTPIWRKCVTSISTGNDFLYSCECYRKRLTIIMYHKRENV